MPAVATMEATQLAAEQGRVLVTANIRDFVPLSNAWNGQGRRHSGIVRRGTRSGPGRCPGSSTSSPDGARRVQLAG